METLKAFLDKSISGTFTVGKALLGVTVGVIGWLAWKSFGKK